MLNTYIKNRGITKTIIHDNNHNHVNMINFDADYNGDVANISLNTNTDGKRKHFNVTLDNEDLANIMNIQSVDIPIDKRLQMDFQEPSYRPEPYLIDLTPPELIPRQSKSVEELLERHISSPVSSEELIIPLTIDRKTKDFYTLTPHKRHKRTKSYITHKVYKKPKFRSKSKSKTKSRTKSKSSRRKTTPIIELL
jgi:hypothetical protein